MLKIALPKGRIATDTLEIFEKIFNKKFEFEDRKLILDIDNFRFLLVRNQDVPVYVYNQAADIGVVGIDVLHEKSYDLIKLLDLGVGKCKICIGIQEGKSLDLNKPEIKIATKLEKITKDYFSRHAIAAKVIKLNGSIELAPLVGLADAIVDIVETGATMRQNSLIVEREIMTSTAHLISNKYSFIQKKTQILNLYNKIKLNIV